MTAESIQKALFWQYKFWLAAPNIHMWRFESDFLGVSKTQYLFDYEIKLSRSDFRADFSKFGYVPGHGVMERGREMTRHEFLLSGKGPNRFYYVFPEGLLADDEVPAWAGIITVKEVRTYGGYLVVKASKKREAKLLHKGKLEPWHVEKIARSLCFRRFHQNGVPV